MSLLSRLFGKKPRPRVAPEPVRPVAAPVPKPPKPDTAAIARAEEDSLAQAIAAADTAAVAKWVLEGSSTRVRQAAAQAVADRTQLDELIPLVRGKDKNVYRILTTKRDALHAADRAVQQRQAEIDGALAALVRHAQRAFDAGHAAATVRLGARWQAVASDATQDQRDAAARALAEAREVVTAHDRAVAAEAERHRAAVEAAEAAERQRAQEAEAAAAAAAERAQRLEAERAAALAEAEAADAALREILGLLRQVQAAVEHGGTARAARLRDTLRARMTAAPTLTLPPWFERKLQDVETRIAELQDWRTFTVVPKRGELVQRMQALVGADMSAEELARQIRRLRDEWRTLHRGAVDEATPEREQFEAAAERAFEPCREHFAQQAERRRENLARREALLERLAAFLAREAEEPSDARMLQRVLGDARREWREHAPVDQSVVESLQERFHALLDQVHARLNADYERNLRARRDLIARVAALEGQADTRQAIDETKALQQQWKAVGPVPRAQDEELWQEFRRHCDAVFQRSAQERAAQGAELDANQARAMALCEELERVAGLDGAELEEFQRKLGAIEQEFAALELPRATARGTRQRFARAARSCEEALHRQRHDAARQAWNGLFEAATAVRAYAVAVSQARPDAECAALHAAAATGIEGLAHAPRAARDVLEDQLSKAAAGTLDLDATANAATLRLLCVRAELMAGLESPADDLELRREYQMRRLVASMGQGTSATSGDLEDLALEWLAVGPVEAGLHDALLTRFRRCFEAA